VQIAFLRAGPQDLPAYQMVLWIAVVFSFFTSLAGLLFVYPVSDAVVRCLAAIVIPALILFAALRIKKKQSRFLQCYAAICGASSFVHVLALPMMPIFFTASVSSLSGKLVVVIILLLNAWMLLITAHIFKHTFNVGLATGVSLALGLMVLTLLAIETIAPSPRDVIEEPSAQAFNRLIIA